MSCWDLGPFLPTSSPTTASAPGAAPTPGTDEKVPPVPPLPTVQQSTSEADGASERLSPRQASVLVLAFQGGLIHALVESPPRAAAVGPACETSASMSTPEQAVGGMNTLTPLKLPSEDTISSEWVEQCTGSELEQWLDSLQWMPFRLCLQHALLQATLCFADRRFELRRMADQVLRPLAEVSLWADLSVLQQQWTAFLPLVDSLPCWVSASTLLLVLQRTHHLLTIPPTSLGPSAAVSARSLTASVCSLLPALVPPVLRLVHAATSDKVLVLSVHLLVFLHARFSHQLGFTASQQQQHFDVLLRLLRAVNHDAHASNAADAPHGANGSSGRGELHARSQAHAQIVERSIVSSIHTDLPPLILLLDVGQKQEWLSWLLLQLELDAEQSILLSLLEATRFCLKPISCTASPAAVHHSTSAEDPDSRTKALAKSSDSLGVLAARRGLFNDPHIPSAAPCSSTSRSTGRPKPALSILLDDNAVAPSARGVLASPERPEVLVTEARVLEVVLRFVTAPALTASVMRGCLAVCGELRLSSSLEAVLSALVLCLQHHNVTASVDTQDPVATQLRALMGGSEGEPPPTRAHLGAAEGDDNDTRSADGDEGDVKDDESDWDDWDEEEDQSAEAGPLLLEVGQFLTELHSRATISDQTDGPNLQPGGSGLLEACLGKMPPSEAAVLLTAIKCWSASTASTPPSPQAR